MKKLKKLLPVVFAAVMAVTLAFSIACKSGCSSCKKEEEQDDPNKTVTYSLSSIELDTSNVKKDYLEGESFSAEGLVIIAKLSGTDGSEKTENLTPTSDGVSVRSNKFNSEKAGEYEIGVNYIYLNVSRSTSYNVKVSARKAGLQVKLKEAQTDTFELSETLQTVDLTGFEQWIEVREPDDWGIVPDNAPVVGLDKLTVELYKNQTKITDVSNLSAGDYQIYASMPYSLNENYILEGFVTVYVVDCISKIEFNSAASGVVTSQPQDVRDIMTPTWKFIASYVSGETENLSASDVRISGVNTVSPTASGATRNATAYYSYTNCKGVTTSVNCKIPYSVTSSGVTDHANSFKRSVLENAIRERLDLVAGAAITDKTQLAIQDFKGDNAFLTLLYEDGANQYRDKNDCFEIKGDALEITTQGMATVEISFASTGGSNVSRIALRDKNLSYENVDDKTGYYNYYEASTSLSAVYDEAGVSIAYETTGTGYVTVTFILAKGGSYVICSPYGKTTRGCRVSSIVVHDYH